MIFTVKENALSTPLLVTDKATWAEIRDDEGHLVLLIIFLPGGKVCHIIDKKDSQFAELARSYGLPFQLDPDSLLNEDR